MNSPQSHKASSGLGSLGEDECGDGENQPAGNVGDVFKGIHQCRVVVFLETAPPFFRMGKRLKIRGLLGFFAPAVSRMRKGKKIGWLLAAH